MWDKDVFIFLFFHVHFDSNAIISLAVSEFLLIRDVSRFSCTTCKVLIVPTMELRIGLD